MKTNWVFKDCDREKQYARKYWSKKVRRLERLLSNYCPDLRRLSLTLYNHASRREWRLRSVLYLPTGTLVAENTSATVEEVIDTTVDELARELRRHKSKVRKEHLIRKRRRRREVLAAATPLLTVDSRESSESNSESFCELLIPHMDQLYDQAQRELEILELEELVPAGEWTPRDLVDDVLVRAFEAYSSRPQGKSIDVWLIELLNARLGEFHREIKPISLVGAPSGRNAVAAVDDGDDLDDIQFWLRQTLESSDPISLDELLPDDELGDVWSNLSTAEQTQRLTQQLRGFPKRQRQALVLHYGYGFELDEIAAALNCDEADVEADLQTGCEKLRHAFSDSAIG